jgi:hypothetical protein
MDTPQIDSPSVSAMRNAATFEVLLPNWLPAKTDMASYRWWSQGGVVEIHTVTRASAEDGVTGRLTIKEWVGAVSDESVIDRGTPGFEARSTSAGTEWLYCQGVPDVWLGAVGDVNIMLSTTFDPATIELFVEHLSGV